MLAPMMRTQEVLDDFQLLIEDAMSVTDEVVVSSLCPRLDDSRANRMVDTVNARLQGLVEGLVVQEEWTHFWS